MGFSHHILIILILTGLRSVITAEFGRRYFGYSSPEQLTSPYTSFRK